MYIILFDLEYDQPIGNEVKLGKRHCSENPLVTAESHLYHPDVTFPVSPQSTFLTAYISLVTLNYQCLLVTGKSTVSQAYFALHETLHKVQIFRKKISFGAKVTSEVFLSISQNLKVTRLQGGTQTKL
jgi:hypothetical protein